MFTPCHVKYISPNRFWNRFSVAAVNEVGEGPEAESSITTSSPAGRDWGCASCYTELRGWQGWVQIDQSQILGNLVIISVHTFQVIIRDYDYTWLIKGVE